MLNTANLDLGDITLQSSVLQDVQSATSRQFDEANERGIFSFPSALPADSKARLSLSFKGPLTGDMMGYYRSTGGKDGELTYTLTQFEVTGLSDFTAEWYIADGELDVQPTAARRAFPCWDEPLLKATFAVTLVSRVNSVNLSNMPAISEEVYKPDSVDKDSWLATKMSTLPDAGQWKVTKFETTPPVMQYSPTHNSCLV